MNYNWNWRIFWEASPEGVGTYLDTLGWGLLWTLQTALLAWVMALVLGAIIGTLRTMPNKLVVRLANGYVELFRNIPLLVQMFLWYFVLPELLPVSAGNWLKTLPSSASASSPRRGSRSRFRRGSIRCRAARRWLVRRLA
jgi:glutamate/aspartate transport system permease protein